jgi:uncharacterized protein YbjT (DUF2867 family)
MGAAATLYMIYARGGIRYELAGPRVYSYRELLQTIAREAGLRPVLMRVPFTAWYALANLAEILPRPPLTRNQVELMQVDTTVSDRPGLRELGISARSRPTPSAKADLNPRTTAEWRNS